MNGSRRRAGGERVAIGAAGEEVVAAWYRRRGYEILDRNWRCSEGELDLVVRRRRTIVFCEVKTRLGNGYGGPFAAVTTEKASRIRRLARRWIAEHDVHLPRRRFDVAAVRPDGVEVRRGSF